MSAAVCQTATNLEISSARLPENLANISAYRHVGFFYLGATAIPWATWLFAGWNSHRPPGLSWPPSILLALGTLGLAAPMLLASVLIGRDPILRRDVINRLFRWPRQGGRFVALAFLLMPVSILLAQVLSLTVGYGATQFRFAQHPSFTMGGMSAWAILVIAPVVEELGWHTYGTDALLRRWPVFASSMLFAAYWGIWHIPLSSIKGYYHSNVMMSGWLYSLNFLLSIFPFVMLMNWLYLRTGRNISVAVVFHITAGVFNEILQTDPASKVIQTGLLILLSFIVLWRERALFFQKPAFATLPTHPSSLP